LNFSGSWCHHKEGNGEEFRRVSFFLFFILFLFSIVG
jgi:hypothetical protein